MTAKPLGFNGVVESLAYQSFSRNFRPRSVRRLIRSVLWLEDAPVEEDEKLLLVYLGRVNQSWLFDDPFGLAPPPEETTCVSFMAGRTMLLDLQQDGVGIAINMD